MNGKTLLEYLACTVGAAIGFLYGDINGMFLALVALCTLDYITGVMVAIKRRRLSSKVGRAGILKKLAIFMLVSVAHLIDAHIIHNGNVFMSMTILYYACNESISILENAKRLGLTVPKRLERILEQVRDDNDKPEKEKDNQKNKEKNEEA